MSFVRLKGKALEQAQKINENGDIHTSGEYGSIEIDENDFVC